MAPNAFCDSKVDEISKVQSPIGTVAALDGNRAEDGTFSRRFTKFCDMTKAIPPSEQYVLALPSGELSQALSIGSASATISKDRKSKPSIYREDAIS